MKHVTHAILLAMLLAAVWLLVRMQALSDTVVLLAGGILYAFGCIVALIAVFCMPELPRLKREKGRIPAHFEMWVVMLFFVASGVLLAIDVFALEQGQAVRYAPAGGFLSVFAACVSVANERMCICWNDEGFVLRTALASIHHFNWAQLTGHHTYRGVTYLHVAGRRYTANLGSKQVVAFLRASSTRR